MKAFFAMENREVIPLLIPQALAPAAAVVGVGIDLGKYEGILGLIIHSDAPTNNGVVSAKITESDALGGAYIDVNGAAFDDVTDVAGQAQLINLDKDKCNDFIRAEVGFAADAGGAANVFIGLVVMKKDTESA